VITSDHAVVELCADLIRFDTSPAGDGERTAAEFLAGRLGGMGLEPRVLEHLPRRSNVVTRISGSEPSRGALLVQMHLDVVPADPSVWSVGPFAGEVRDGYLWGRGAVDMKNMVAMVLCTLQAKLSHGWQPRRDIVVALLADEEMGGGEGAEWLVEQHADEFEGCTESIGEAGGFTRALADGRRAYFVQIAEKGITWFRLVARGPGGHGSLIHENSPIATIAEAIGRLNRFVPVLRPLESTGALLSAAREWTGESDPDAALDAIGPLGRLLRPTLRNTFSVTRVAAGVQNNVVPPVAEAFVDGRYVPGFGPQMLEEIRDLLGDLVEIEVVHSGAAVQTTFSGSVPDAITAALAARDPDAAVIPVCLPIGTDGKHFSRLGIRNYGFIPLVLPENYDFPAMFHGVDERVPVAALEAGIGILDAFFDQC
jgi:acetylornithine deacetylase/succinyl-diaminopimelate desuccinylase-like protein